MRFSFRRIFKKAADKIMLAASTVALALPAVAAETSNSVDMSGVTSGIVNLVMALMPVIIVIVVIKALLESFMRMT